MPNIKINQIVNIREIFKKLENKSYCIIKLPEIFPYYDIGSDLDIFCYDIQDISQIILLNIQKNISNEIEIEITDNKTQIYIDIIKNNKIHFRFDLYGALPIYNNICIKKAFFSSIIENSQTKILGNLQVKVPNNIDEAILRYIEYHEWYSQRPDKIKHIEYIEKKIKVNEINIDNMFDKLHFYITIPNSFEDRKITLFKSFIEKLQYLTSRIKFLVNYLKKKGLIETLIQIKIKIVK